jgi:hypothetical protein
MKSLILAALASTILLAGCATGNGKGELVTAEDDYVPLGTNIPRKKTDSSKPNVVNTQALENERTMNSATLTN